ncbi:MAG TPA: L,D-transpeptidase family protein [Pyrinomonadaceae bacterium]|nr:L,D-transpeptidase family protein [Pyrinomonadaceae bacterium]
MKNLFYLLVFGLLVVSCANDSAAQNSGVKNAKNAPQTSPTPNAKNTLPKMENPHLVVKKSARTLELFDGEKLIKTYKIGLGFAPEGDKEKEGDGKTPEGDFYIFTKNPKSSFYLSLGLSYPNLEDAKRGLDAKLITKAEYDQIETAIKNKKMPPQKTKLGGEIYIHGNGSSKDWTWGCVALENEDIKELFDALEIGVNVKIMP